MSTKDDEDWAKILAGGDAEDADPKVRRNAQALRDALTRRLEAILVEGSDEAWLTQLRAKIGAGAQPATPSVMERIMTWMQGFSMPQLATAALLVLGIGVGLRLAMQDSSDTVPEMVTREFPAGERIYLEVDDPAARQSSLAQALKTAGIEPRILSEPGGEGAKIVQASIPLPIDAKLTLVLAQHGLGNFPGGDLDVGFRRRR